MDSAHQDHDDKCIEETTSDQLLHPDSPDINDIFGEPLVHPRVGYEYQVEIPLMITESERDKLLVNPADAEVIVDVSHSFLMGLPIPIVQVLDEKRSQINSNKKGSQLKVESLDVMLNPGKESTATSPDSKVMGSTDLDQMHGSKSYLTVPGSLDLMDTVDGQIVGRCDVGSVYMGRRFLQDGDSRNCYLVCFPGLTGMPKYTAGGVNYSLFLLQCVPTKLLCY
ncbi:hypothetical protein CK203_087612 [Vitis vinifera]|uniref:Uncharacterized protein n=1 Tax=Vitis vinifera TaxID=29760 RepID=A0A438EZS3_VITVI|nr:hypothetical protein CK203_087612 [Vitis vinifera]